MQRLKTLCPPMGKLKIAQTLCRAGLHLGTTTVGRMLKEKPKPKPANQDKAPSSGRVVTAKYPKHVWHADLTVVPTSLGFWVSWLPFTLPQCWPFCWWVAVTVDHFSRRVMGFAVLAMPPSSEAIRAFLGRTIAGTNVTPRYIICDQGPQFWNDGFKDWCRRKGIRPRFGAIGKHGSLAVIERFILTLKTGCTRWLGLVPYRRNDFCREWRWFIDWYNGFRPHTALRGKTPDEVYYHRFPACRRPHFEPRPHWPRASPCAAPHALVRGKQGARLELNVTFHGGRKHLPIVALRRAG